MKQKLILFFVIACCLNGMNQDLKFFNQRPKKNLFLELAGNGGLVSINHEKINLISFKLMMVSKIGLGCTQDYSFKSPENYFISFIQFMVLIQQELQLLFLVWILFAFSFVNVLVLLLTLSIT